MLRESGSCDSSLFVCTLFYFLVSTLPTISGCAQSTLRTTGLDSELALEEEAEAEVKTVGIYAMATGLRPIRVESVALITGLDGTGSDPPPSNRRSRLIGEMQRRQVDNPNTVLKSDNTSLGLAVGLLPPGIKKGDRFDIEVRVPTKSRTQSLRSGWLMPTELTEFVVMGDNEIHDGHNLARAEGPILVDSFVKGTDDKVNEVRGRILGGGVALRSRDLRLVMRSDKTSVRMSSLVGAAINRRFHGYQNGIKQGMATPKTDQYIELKLHPKYQQNIQRYLRIIQHIPLRLNASEQISYLKSLKTQLKDPTSTALSALRLEALGQDAVDVLASGLESNDHVVSFHAAEALAYLDDARGVTVLGETIVNHPVYRQRGLTALAAVEDLDADDELEKLLHVDSVESRYGAFRAIRKRNPTDPLIPQYNAEGDFYLHVVASSEEPLVHLAWRERPEVVLFGSEIKLKQPALIFAGKRLMIDSRQGDAVKISMFRREGGDVHDHCSSRLDDVLNVVARLGGTYPEVVQLLRNARSRGYLTARLAFDSVPEFGLSRDQSNTFQANADADLSVKTVDPEKSDEKSDEDFGKIDESAGSVSITDTFD